MRLVLTFPFPAKTVMSRLRTCDEKFEYIMQNLHTAKRSGMHSSEWTLYGANGLEIKGEFRLEPDYTNVNQLDVDTPAQNV